jgi:hypothetical protein
MKDELGPGHRLLDRLQGDAGELRKLDIPTLKKAARVAGDLRLAEMMDEAIVGPDGTVDIRATAVKFGRREFYKNLSPDDARLKPQWANPGTSDAAPRGAGSDSRVPALAPQSSPTPVMTSAGAVYQQGKHDPEYCVRLIQALLDQQRRQR